MEVPTLRGKAKVTVPAGTHSGEILRLRGQGLPSLDGGGTGSLLVRVLVETPKKLSPRMREPSKRHRRQKQKKVDVRPQWVNFAAIELMNR